MFVFYFSAVVVLLTAFPHSVFTMPVVFSGQSNIPGNFGYLDMSYTYDNSTPYWPSDDPSEQHFRLDVITRGVINLNNHSVYMAQNKFATPEHGGSHVDAPAHFVPNGIIVDGLPLERLIGPAVKISIQKQVTEARKNGIDYLMSKDDVFAWEEQHGIIANGSLVFVFTGQGRFWPDPLKYMGYDGVNRTDLHYPGISEAAAQLFVDRGVKVVGIDTVSPDNMRNIPSVHLVLLNAGVLILENVANLDRLPTFGATAYGLPLKIGNGSGGPVRLFAQIPM